MSQRAARFALLLRWGILLVGLTVPTGCALAGNSGERDARLVYCLDTAHRAELADAAVVLGLAQRGTTPERLAVAGKDVSLEAWRAARRDDFDRACDALNTAARPQTQPVPPEAAGGGESLAYVLLPVAVGALLSWLAAEWRAKTVTARMEADNLRAAVRGYVRAHAAYAGDWVAQRSATHRPDDRHVRERHDEVDAQLRRIGGLHADWRVPGRLRTDLAELTDDVLREDRQGWVDLSPGDRQDLAHGFTARLGTFDTDTELVAVAIERPWRSRRAMRAVSAPARGDGPDGRGDERDEPPVPAAPVVPGTRAAADPPATEEPRSPESSQ